MINKQRVQRIRGFIYTCILLLIFLPILLTMVFSFRTMDLLTTLTAQLAQNPPTYSQQGDGSQQGNDLEPVGQSASAKPDAALSGEEPQSRASAEDSKDEGNEPSAKNGRYVQNTYLPRSYPELYFDTIPETKPLEDNTLYITLDNTPSNRADQILSVLEKHDVKATFFVWWNQHMDENNSAFYKRLLAEGHQIGIHPASSNKSFSEIYASVDSFLEEFESIFEIVSVETGYKPRIYRLPGGSVNPYDAGRQQILSDIKAELDARGFLQFDWTASAQDAVLPSLSKKQVLENIRGSIGNGRQIILLAHDGTGSNSTAEALDELIAQYKAEGYAFGVLENDSESVSFF